MLELPLYKTMDRRVVYKTRKVNDGIRNLSSGMADKGDGYIYIIQNTHLKGWFKVGSTKNKKTFKGRMTQYKSIIPIGKWEVLKFTKVKDMALEELRLKHYYRYGLGYEMGVNSREWFKGNSDKKVIFTPYKKKERVPNKGPFNGARYTYKGARDFVRQMKKTK